MKFVSLLFAYCVFFGASLAAADRPNLILIFTDDQGYHDLGCQGSTTIRTPRLDRMAAEGLRLTSFYAQPVCGVSRAALMTGCYPIRVAEPGNVKRLHSVPHPREVTMAEVLKSAGYATALIGKWHLGLNGDGPGKTDPATMPNAQGFDYFYGTPKYNGATVHVTDSPARSPILRNDEVVVQAVQSWDSITQDYTRESIAWIREHQDQPFFLYLAHNMPHIPLGASEAFKGKSAYGPYGDAIEEIDWSTGQILDELKALGLDDQTLVVFTSDNGPWVETTVGMKPGGKKLIPRDHSGTADPLRGWKMSAWDGGCRVPFLARWPERIKPARVSDQILSTMDLLPTFARLAGAKLPEDRTLDGHDATRFLLGETETSPRDDYLYYSGCLLTSIRSDKWKLVLPRVAAPPGTGWWGRMIEKVDAIQLFDLDTDPGETKNLADQHPDVVARLMQRLENARTELGDIDRTGSGARFFDEGPRRLETAVKKEPAKANAAKPFPPVGNLRFTFEGDDLDGWKIVEGQFDQPVTAQTSLPRHKDQPFAREGKQHLSTVATTNGASDKQTGIIESPPFQLEGDQIAFLIGGGFDETNLHLALIDDTTGDVLLRAGGEKDPHLRRVLWEVSKWKNRRLKLRLTDHQTSGWGHLNVDDVSLEAEIVR